MRRILAGVAVAAVMGFAQQAAAEAGNVEKGKAVFKRCAVCHVLNKEQNRVGPHLVEIVGRKAGVVEKFNYSKALLKMAEDGLVWDKESLDKYLTKPKDFIKGGKMAFAGLSKEKDRTDLIAYLEAEAKAQ